MEGGFIQTVAATVAVVGLWAAAAALVIGSGVLVAWTLRLSDPIPVSTYFWLGLGMVVGWFFLIHIWFPLDSPEARVPVAVAGMAGWILVLRPDPMGWVRSRVPRRPVGWLIPAGLLTLVLVLANLALSEPTNYDSFLYHFASIRYYSEFPAIEGLVNLYYPLANQSATLSLASGLDVWPFQGEGYRLVNGLLVAALAVELGSRLARAAKRRSVGLGDSVLVVSTVFFILIPGAASAATMVASPGLDTGAAVLFIVGFAYFTDAVTRPSAQSFALALMVLSVSATFRPLNFAFLVIAAPLILTLVLRNGERRASLLVRPVILGTLLLLTAAVHSTIVSGYPFYPATFPSFGLPWAHPTVEAADTRAIITQFARGRLDDPIYLTESLGATVGWFGEWIGYLRESGQLGRLALLGFAALGGVVAIVIQSGRKKGLGRLLVLLAPLLPIVGIWFISAPLIRFGFGPLAVLFATPVALALIRGKDLLEFPGRWSKESVVWFRLGSALLLVGLAVITVGASSIGKGGRFPIAADGTGRVGSSPPRPVGVERERVAGGLSLASPTIGDWCGFALWCTPNPDRGLALRGKAPEDGFERVDGTYESRFP